MPTFCDRCGTPLGAGDLRCPTCGWPVPVPLTDDERGSLPHDDEPTPVATRRVAGPEGVGSGEGEAAVGAPVTVEQPTVLGASGEQASGEEPSGEEPTVEEPTVEQPTVEQPMVVEAMVVEASGAAEPPTGQPAEPPTEPLTEPPTEPTGVVDEPADGLAEVVDWHEPVTEYADDYQTTLPEEGGPPVADRVGPANPYARPAPGTEAAATAPGEPWGDTAYGLGVGAGGSANGDDPSYATRFGRTLGDGPLELDGGARRSPIAVRLLVGLAAAVVVVLVGLFVLFFGVLRSPADKPATAGSVATASPTGSAPGAAPSSAAPTSSSSAPASTTASPSTTAYPPVTLTGSACGTSGTGALANVAAGNASTSCPFAQAVQQAVVAARPAAGQSVNVTATSPVTKKPYAMSCSGTQPVTCTGGNGAVVYLYGGTATFR